MAPRRMFQLPNGSAFDIDMVLCLFMVSKPSTTCPDDQSHSKGSVVNRRHDVIITLTDGDCETLTYDKFEEAISVTSKLIEMLIENDAAGDHIRLDPAIVVRRHAVCGTSVKQTGTIGRWRVYMRARTVNGLHTEIPYGPPGPILKARELANNLMNQLCDLGTHVVLNRNEKWIA